MRFTNRFRPLVAVACISAFLSGCGGGSNTRTDTEMLEVPATMVASSLAPTYADSIADTFESTTGTALGPLQAPIMLSTVDVSLTGDSGAYVTSVTRDGMGGATVEFVVDGQTHQVDFTRDQIATGERVTKGDRNFELNSLQRDSNPLDKVYFRVARWATWTNDPDGSAGYASLGVRTRVENLPMGSATYEGYMFGETWNNAGNRPGYSTHARQAYGLMTLNADFDDSEISGEVNGLWLRDTRADGRTWNTLPETTSIAISGGRIVGNQFTADWMGQDTDANNPALTSARGLEGDMLGEFYGPNAEEVGGVMNGHRDATDTTPSQTFTGAFGGERQP